MVYTSRYSLIGRKYSKCKRKDEKWYEDVIDIIINNVDSIREEDVTIAVESTIFAINLQKRHEESLNDEDFDEYGAEFDKLSMNPLNFRESQASLKESESNGCLKGSLFTMSKYFGRNKTADDANSDAESIMSDGTEMTNQIEGGMYGSESLLHGWPLSMFFSDKGKSDRQKRFIAFAAWAVAFAGLVTALTFLTRDFIRSTKETPSVVHYESSYVLDIPKVWFCTGDTYQPFFFDVPPGYSGQPLFWIDYIKGTLSNIDVEYPDTRRLTQIDFTTRGAMGADCNASQVMDVDKFFAENYESPSCFHCIVVRRTPPLAIARSVKKTNEIDLSSRVAFRLSRQSFLKDCRVSQMGMKISTHAFFKGIFKKYSSQLEEKGIVDFGGLDPLNGSNDGRLFPYYRVGGMNTTIDLVVHDLIDMYCNVYIFSGHFYPTKADTDIRFQFDAIINKWKRLGKGPYYPPNFDEFYQQFERGIFPVESKQGLGEEELDSKVVNSGEMLYVFTNASTYGQSNLLNVIVPNQISSISFSRNEINGKELYQTKSMSARLLQGDSRSINNVYFIDLTFSGFFTRIVTQQKAMAWTAFLADFFGLTSLFLDISMYTILISPIAGRKAPGAQKSRKRANAKAKKEMRVGYRRQKE